MSTDVGITSDTTGIWQPGSELNNQGLEAVMMACMDRKLTFKRRHPLREKYKIMFPDLLTHGGGPYRICDPEAFGGQVSERRRRLWVSQCDTCEYDINEVAVGAHGITRIILATHQKCGMAGLDGHKFNDILSEEELQFHRKIHEMAGNWVADNCPQITEIIPCFEYYEMCEEKCRVQIKEVQAMAA